MRLPRGSEMDPREKATLQSCRNCLMEDLDPSKAFLSSLHNAGIVTEDQKDRIEKQTTRQDKVVTLMEILPRRGPRAFRLFVGVLQKDYQWISDRMQAELSVQEYTAKIQAAVEERIKGEFIRDKDYIFKILNETVIPIVIQELQSDNSTASIPTTSIEKPLRDLIYENLLPLIQKSKGKMKLDSLPSEALIGKMTEILIHLQKKCYTSLGVEYQETCDNEDPLPDLIEKALSDSKSENDKLKREAKKFKTKEDKLTAENHKLKSDLKAARDEVKKLKSEGQSNRVEIKKLKDEVKRGKSDNEKLKLETSHLKEILNKAGVDLRISNDFTE